MVRPILVVDDVAAGRVAAEAALASVQRPIVTAASGTEALARVLEHDVAVILLAVEMPDGYETVNRIRARSRAPIVFLTEHEPEETAVLRAYALGAVDVLAKSVVPEVLCAKVAAFIALQERTREQSDRRQDSFIGILAHELRNPLAPVRTCIDLVRADPELRLTPKMLDILDRQTSVLVRLVDDLLDLSRIKADKIELRPERIDLVDVVDHAIATSRPLIDERGQVLVFEAPATQIDVIVDTVRFGQVLANIINNAARYTPPQGRIEITCTSDDEHATISVTDTGIGIPPELQESIFQMFVQERVTSDGSGGLGLGLALARRLVELHHGTIRVRSEGVDRGSTFEVRIPLATSGVALTPRKRTRDMAPLPRPASLAAIRTVVIDDNDDARELLCDLLRARGCEVLPARDGPSGLSLIREHEPHVALVDLGLPGLDGIAVIETLRKERPDLKTRLVALTGYGEAADRERTRAAGFHAHIVKPASAAVIFDVLSRALED